MNGITMKPVLAWLAALLFLLGFNPAGAFEVQRVEGTTGTVGWLIEDHTNPIIAIRFAFRGGAALDPEGREGLAEMAAGLLDEGAGHLDSTAFQRKLEDLAITLRFDTGRDSFGGRLKTLTKNRDDAFDLLRMALTMPRFDAEPVERIRGQILANLRREEEDPDVMARRELFRTLFPDHPYGKPVSGTKESIAAIGQKDLKGFVERRIARDDLVIGAVGDITPDELAAALDWIFGELPMNAADWNISETTPPATGGVTVVETAVPQSSIVFAQRGPRRNDPDYYAAYVMNHILGGGGFTARLYHEVREKRGLAYSVYSALAPLDFSGIIFGGSGTRNDRAAETVDIIRAEWARMATEGPTPEELDDAKRFLTGSFPLRFSSSDNIASILVAIQMDDLGIDYLDRRNSLIEAVTLDDVRRVARDFLNPESLHFVVAGQPEGLKPGG